jgi:ubiquinone/menaquinone biosynthesis C-methylase UbiE
MCDLFEPGKYACIGCDTILFDSVLNFGCGPGTKTLALAGSVKQITGIDISEKMIDLAMGKVKENPVSNVKFKQGSLPDPSLPENAYDAVIAFNILHLLDNKDEILDEIQRLLKPEGLFISSTPCLREKMSFGIKISFLFYRILMKLGLLPLNVTFFTFDDLDQMFEKSNFTLVETEPFYRGMSGYFVVAKNGL